MEPCSNIWNTLERGARLGLRRTALVEGERVWTYGDLDRRARARACHWRARGVRPGDRVAVLAENRADFLVAYFAAAWLGAVLVPLNHRLAPAELVPILALADPRLVLVDDGLGPLADALRARGRPIEPLAPAAPQEVPVEDDRGPHPTGPDDLAQLYFTSGTTGRPKGVMLTHGNVCAHAAAAVEELDLGPDERWGHFAPMFHLADAWAVFAVTQVGGVHVFCPRFEAETALGWIERARITSTNLVPTMLGRLLEALETRGAAPDLTSLRLVLTGGAPISPALVRRTVALLGCEYAQTYGMTETSPYLTLGRLPPHLAARPEAERLRRMARTGRPYRGVELEVVDPAGERVPADDRTVGEIRVRGRTVSPGYWRDPEATRAAFRGGWLYTGDLAVVDEEGFLDIVDRKKDMILTGGENVYSTEVEHVLHEHPAVLEAAVFALPDVEWGERVGAAVVPRAGRTVDAGELTRFVRERLAGFKVPREIHVLDALPRTGSGKISKRALRRRFGRS